MASGATSPDSGREIPVGESSRWAESPPDAAADAAAPVVIGQVVIGRVVRPFGRRGEVFVEPLTDDPGRFFEIESAEVGPEDRPGTRRGLESVRIHKGRPVVRFDGVTDITAAETLRGMEIRIREGERAPLPEGRYYSDELVGCRAEDEAGVHLGEIVDTLDTAGPCLLVLRSPQGAEDLIPFVEALCVRVELPAGEAAGRVVLNVPDGLLGLNDPAADHAR